jgi:hypothetical protein
MTTISFDYVDEIIFVARRPVMTFDDVDAVVKRGFRSVIVLNDLAARHTGDDDSKNVNLADAFLSKNVQYISDDVPIASIDKLVDSGQVGGFERDYSERRFDKVVSHLDTAPRPTLVVVSSHAAHVTEIALAVVYAYLATRFSLVHNVKKLTPAMREIVEAYVETKLNRIVRALFLCWSYYYYYVFTKSAPV